MRLLFLVYKSCTELLKYKTHTAPPGTKCDLILRLNLQLNAFIDAFFEVNHIRKLFGGDK